MGDADDPRFATTLARGLSVLRSFRTTDDGLSNAELAERTGLPKSTVSRLTWTLRRLGYLTQSERDDRFRPGPTLVAVGHVAAVSLSFMEPAHRLMAALANETGTLVVLSVRDGDKLVLIRTWRPTNVSSLWLDVGYRLPLAGYSSARAFVGALSPAEYAGLQRQVDPAAGFAQLADPGERLQARNELIARGFVLTPGGEDAPASYNAVSVPIRPSELNEPVVFTCGALPTEASLQRLETVVGPRLRAAVTSLERLTGQLGNQTRSKA
ncbi:IclR family transcriptional regulator [uncultured Paracoccus sp.]|uniref:IclR family transcriptional regulator n=1 Tax=uncultured Paracoccus sp. TaxID=189685 RepID=UPI002607ED63|nr:IclR family transcriptional regulator [uncultured Paracoccus sp.]